MRSSITTTSSLWSCVSVLLAVALLVPCSTRLLPSCNGQPVSSSILAGVLLHRPAGPSASVGLPALLLLRWLLLPLPALLQVA